jgi:zinc transport system ATP-binding protein
MALDKTLVNTDGALIQVKNLSLLLHEKLILDQITFDVYSREIVTILGPNGAGKTSLVRVLLNLQKYQRGQIEYASDLTMGYVPQRIQINPFLPLSVGRFLALFNNNHAVDPELLENLGLSCADLQKSMHDLSGGELQRVLLVQAVANKPRLVFLDEPTRGIDVKGQMDFYQWLLRLRDVYGMAIVLVSHDLHMVMAKTDRVLCLNRHLCCVGTPSVVAEDPEYLALYHHHHNHAHATDGAIV